MECFWPIILGTCLTSLAISKFMSHKDVAYISMFRPDQIIFVSNFNVTKLLVPADGSFYVQKDFSDIPSIFFTINDPKLDGGSCIYVLEDLAAYEILEGGRDSTSDYSNDKTVFFGAKDGVYKYDAESLSAKRYGPFRDDIIQIQTATGKDTIFFLTANNQIYKLENNGTFKTRVQAITCALEFVLDTSNNIYYIDCNDGLPHIMTSDGNIVNFVASVTDDFEEIKLLRPAFIMEKCIPFVADGKLYILYENGTNERKDLFLKEHPTAYSIDAALYLVAAVNGKIYEFNVMEMMLKSLFGYAPHATSDLSKIVMSIIETAKDGIYRERNNILQ